MMPRDPLNPTAPVRTERHQSRTADLRTNRWAAVWAGLAVALPVLVFAVVWDHYAVNVPKWDDHALRAFLFYSDQETTLGGKLYQLVRQHNEHRIVYDRLITLLDFNLFGELNFRHLMIVGNGALIGLLLVFGAVLRREWGTGAPSGRSVLAALPVALLLFNLSQWENMFWGMAALQNFSVVLWALAAFYYLSYTDRWGLALTAAVLATLTSGNGLLVWPIGVALLTLRPTNPVRVDSVTTSTGRERLSRTWTRLLGWIVGAAVVVGLYFWGFEKPTGNPPVRGSLTDLLRGWLAFLGAAAEALPAKSPLPISMRLGGLLTLATLGIVGAGLVKYRTIIGRAVRQLVIPTGVSKSTGGVPPITLFFWGSVVFVLGTAAVVAWSRTGFGLDLLITSRYKIYSLTLLSLLYVYAVATVGGRIGRWFLTGSVVGSLVLAALSYVAFLDETIWWRHWLTTNQFNWAYTTDQPVATRDTVTERYTRPARAFYEAALPTLYGPARQPVVPLSVAKTPNGFAVVNATLPALGLRDAGNYLVARSAKRIYLFPVWQNQRSPIQAGFMPTKLLTTGFRATFLAAELEAGTYQLLVLTIPAGGHPALRPTNQTITSAGGPIDTTQKNW